jgi:hypothetical protein
VRGRSPINNCRDGVNRPRLRTMHWRGGRSLRVNSQTEPMSCASPIPNRHFAGRAFAGAAKARAARSAVRNGPNARRITSSVAPAGPAHLRSDFVGKLNFSVTVVSRG